MKDSDLTKLRRARTRCHKALKQAEELAAGYRTKLADLEARIQAIAPDLKLPARFHDPIPISSWANCADWQSTCSARPGVRWRSRKWRWPR